MEKYLVDKYVSTFGIENIIIITDNTKVYRNGDGRFLFIDFTKEVCHSVGFENEERSVSGPGLFEIESFQFSEIQFMSVNADVKQMEKFLQMLISEKTINVDKANEVIENFKNTARYYKKRDPNSVLADVNMNEENPNYKKYKYDNVPINDNTKYEDSLNVPIYRKNFD